MTLLRLPFCSKHIERCGGSPWLAGAIVGYIARQELWLNYPLGLLQGPPLDALGQGTRLANHPREGFNSTRAPITGIPAVANGPAHRISG